MFYEQIQTPSPLEPDLGERQNLPERSVVRRPQPGPCPPCLPRYFLIERGKNMCGLAACASYPIPLV